MYIGVGGAIVSLAVVILLVTAGTLGAHNLLFIVGAQAAWYLGLAYVLNKDANLSVVHPGR
ncbi:MAG: hypothetical protein JO165_00930 [Candidatus Eremiobacteraeota bacterium]|nr:hypothetical protein [Candidatus Eremiobacteraeota bacterium]